MKKLISLLLAISLLLCLIPAVSAEAIPNAVTGIGTQLLPVYAGSNTVYQSVFIIDINNRELTVETGAPISNDFNYSFALNENETLDYSGIQLSFSILQYEDSNYYCACNISINSSVAAGTYYFETYYGVNAIPPASGEYSVLTISEAPPVQETVTIADAGRSLSLSDIVYINDYARIEGTGNYSADYIRSNGGLLVFTSEISEEAATFEAAQANGYYVQGLVGGNGNEYAQRTKGITSVLYRNTYYLRIYLKLSDGTYIYTPLKAYGVHVYCTNKLADGSGASQGLKNVCQALLAYGDYASAYFGSSGTT